MTAGYVLIVDCSKSRLVASYNLSDRNNSNAGEVVPWLIQT